MERPIKGLSKKRKIHALKILLTVFCIMMIIHFIKDSHKKKEYTPRDYTEIISSGKLRAVTEYNSISFHADADSVEGFHYELIQKFAKSKEIEADITPEMSFSKRIEGVLNGKYDILANSTPIISELQDTLFFTHPILVSKQVLIQRIATGEADSIYVRNHLELANKTIHVVKDSPVLHRIQNLSNEIGDTIYVHEIEKYGPEQLVALVANGDIDYAVCDENIAKSSQKDFPNIDIQIDISFSQFYSWGVNKQSKTLLDSLNVWLDNYLQTKDFKTLKQKYFGK